MELKDALIYPYIKGCLDEVCVINYKKGQCIALSSKNLEEIFFILNGKVKVECITKFGKNFFVDNLSENEFVGHISYLHEQNLNCDIIAVTSCSLLKIEKQTFKKLQNNPEFMKIFLFKTSNRIYHIYKKLMMRNLFSLDEIVAFHILDHAENNIFRYKSMYHLCEVLSVSRKSLYNVMNRLLAKDCISKNENSILILNRQYLQGLAMDVQSFSQTNSSGESSDFD